MLDDDRNTLLCTTRPRADGALAGQSGTVRLRGCGLTSLLFSHAIATTTTTTTLARRTLILVPKASRDVLWERRPLLSVQPTDDALRQITVAYPSTVSEAMSIIDDATWRCIIVDGIDDLCTALKDVALLVAAVQDVVTHIRASGESCHFVIGTSHARGGNLCEVIEKRSVVERVCAVGPAPVDADVVEDGVLRFCMESTFPEPRRSWPGFAAVSRTVMTFSGDRSSSAVGVDKSSNNDAAPSNIASYAMDITRGELKWDINPLIL